MFDKCYIGNRLVFLTNLWLIELPYWLGILGIFKARGEFEPSHLGKFFHSLITARKRSLGQGNIFIGVCQEFCSQGWCLVPGGSAPGGCLLQGGAWLGGCLVGGCLLLGGCLVETHPPGWLLLRAVRILLECILVFVLFSETDGFKHWNGCVQHHINTFLTS